MGSAHTGCISHLRQEGAVRFYCLAGASCKSKWVSREAYYGTALELDAWIPQAGKPGSHGMKTSEQEKSQQTPFPWTQRYTGLLENSLSESSHSEKIYGVVQLQEKGIFRIFLKGVNSGLSKFCWNKDDKVDFSNSTHFQSGFKWNLLT